MALKEEMLLGDREVLPTDEYVFALLGEKRLLWQDIHKYAMENFKDISGSWNYYNDGKQWLYKLVQKKKTIFWSALMKDTFRITFYFSDKAEPVLEKSDLDPRIISGFKSAKRYGLIRPVSFKVFDETDAENVKKLIAVKIKIK
jgi:hypothetical protein